MDIIPRMVVAEAEGEAVSAADAISYVQAMAGDLAVMCLTAGRPDAALVLLRVVQTLQRPVQPADAYAAPGDAA